MIDSATIIDNLTLEGNGESASINRNYRAGMFLRSVNWAPQIRNLSVNSSAMDGIFLESQLPRIQLDFDKQQWAWNVC